jgi:hypothetical protein
MNEVPDEHYLQVIEVATWLYKRTCPEATEDQAREIATEITDLLRRNASIEEQTEALEEWLRRHGLSMECKGEAKLNLTCTCCEDTEEG